MRYRSIVLIICVIILSSVLVTANVSSEDSPIGLKDWSYSLKINIPIDTSLSEAKYQPIDIPIEFENPCWARDEINHSIRVYSQYGGKQTELESQIYDLNFTDMTHINSCNLVFLIPENANGNEEYYVYYHDNEKSSPDYDDRVSVKDSYYSYQPYQGLSFESWYYSINQGEHIVYGLIQKGETLGEPIAQNILKAKPESIDIKPQNGDHAASLAFFYWTLKDGKWISFSTAEKLLHKEVIIDGNLMTKCLIVSGTNNGLLKSTIYYKYYYNPTNDRRLYAHVKHEVVDYPLPADEDIDVSFAMMNCGGIKSSLLPELNFGNIPPYLHLYSDEDRMKTYDLDTTPEGFHWQEIIGKKDDCDLGSFAWASADFGKTGNAQGFIFDSNEIIKSGEDERDGIEIQLHEANTIQLPGLDASFAYIYFMRNSYEPNTEPDIHLPEDYVVEFKLDLFSSENGGYEAVEKEAVMFQSLIDYQPEQEDDIVDENGETEEYNLTAYIFPKLSTKLEILGSTLLLKNPSISCELYYENEASPRYTGRAGRITFNEEFGLDLGNISLFRKVRFENVKPGKYVLKIFLKNPLVRDNSKFIGYKIIDVKNDMSINVFCKTEGKLNIKVKDQNKNGIENVEVYLFKKESTITKSITDSNGEAILYAPCGYDENYNLTVYYKGFLIKSEQIEMGRSREIIPLEKNLGIDVHTLSVKILDSQGRVPDFDVDISLTSDAMEKRVEIIEDTVEYGEYKFYNVYAEDYKLKIKFNEYEIEELINIPETSIITIDLFDYFVHIKDNWDFNPEVSLDVYITSDEFVNDVVINGEKITDNGFIFSNIYPGNYTLNIGYRKHLLEKDLRVPDGDNNNITVIFPAIFNVTTTVYDSHGNPLKEAIVKMIRSQNNIDKEIKGVTNSEGKLVLSLPPGIYLTKVLLNGEIIAERNIDVLSDKKCTVVTTAEPIAPLIIIIASIIIIIIMGFICFKHKNILLFVLTFIVLLSIVSVVSPWWTIEGSSISPNVSSKTNQYLIPAEMVTIISSDEVESGEIASLNEEFVSAIELIPTLIYFGILFIFLSVFLNRYEKKKLSLLCLLATIGLFIISMIILSIAINELSKVTVGNFIGSGDINTQIPGTADYVSANSFWGPGIGFYMLLVSTIILTIIIIYNLIILIKKYKKEC